MALRGNRRSTSGKGILSAIFLIFIAGAGIGGFLLFFEGDMPVIDLASTGNYLGKNGKISFAVSDQTSGIKSIQVTGEQGGTVKNLLLIENPRTGYTGEIGPLEMNQSITVDVQKEGFKDGDMTINVTVTDFSLRGWLKGNKTTVSRKLMVDTHPPVIQIAHTEKYISPGGCGIAIYRLNDVEAKSGVLVNNKYFNPGFPVGDGRNDTFISFFALPYDTESIVSLQIQASDEAGNSSVVAFSTNFKKADQKHDNITISDGFLSTKIPEFQQYYPEMQGSDLEKYLYSNRTIRVANNTKIRELCSNPDSQRYWKDAFGRMAGSGRAGFADHRTYYYNGKAIDQQVHLGMDIASTRRADVRAANNGKVIFADYLGIYGNMVMIDHGQGVFTLYSHLSQIITQVGAMVDQSTVLGLTGTTGMAGGDHLHFSVLINGIFVTPKEWWDQHWIDVTINQPLLDSKF